MSFYQNEKIKEEQVKDDNQAKIEAQPNQLNVA